MVEPIYIIAALLSIAFLLPVLEKVNRQVAYGFFFLTLLFVVGVSVEWLWALISGSQDAVYIFTAGVKPPLSINLKLGLEEAVFITSINSLALVGALYLWNSLKKIGNRSFVLILLMTLGMNGLVMTRDLFNVFVFMEITSISTYAVIGMDLNLKSLISGFKYMVAGGIASVFMLLGIIVLYYQTGTLNIDDMISMGIGANVLPVAIFGLFALFTSFLIEMKQFPANGWALDVYEAATPGVASIISASGTAAVMFALYKILPFANNNLLSIISWVGVLTFFFSNLMGLKQENGRRLLGYSSIGQMGLLLGMTAYGFTANTFPVLLKWALLALFLNHFVAKAGLFWLAGIINEEEWKSWKFSTKRPILFILFGIFTIGLIGLPPFPGFWGKWNLIMKLSADGRFGIIFLILLGSLFEAGYMLRWFGNAVKQTKDDATSGISWNTWVGPVLFAFGYFILGSYFAIRTNGVVYFNLIPLFGLIVLFAIDWLPFKLKNMIFILMLGGYGLKTIPHLAAMNQFFAAFFLVAGLVLALALFNRREKSVGFLPLMWMMLTALSALAEAGNLIQFFLAWEFMTLSSYLLIMRGKKSLKPALVYIVFSLAGAFSILGGISLAWLSAPYSIGFDILSPHNGFAIWIYSLIAIGFLVKVAALGLHIWVGGAYSEAEDDVTPFISGILSKAGIWGMIVLITVMGTTQLAGIGMNTLLGWIGAFTALWGTLIAVFQEDMKKMLAYSSMGQVGYIVMGAALMSHLGWMAAFWHTVVHFLFKGLLFLAIAGVIYRTGTRKMYELGGLIKKMPFSFVSVLIGIIALAGMPPLAGFGSKWLLYEALIEKGWYLQTAMAFFASTIAFLYCYRLIHTIFLGQEKDNLRHVKEAPVWLLLPQYILIIAIMVLSVHPQFILAPASAAISSVIPSTVKISGMVVYNSLGYWNATIIMIIVGVIFAGLLIFRLLIGPKPQKVKQFNIVYAAERPESPELTHYAWDFFAPYRRAMGWMLKPVVRAFWNGVAKTAEIFGGIIRLIYSGSLQTDSLFILALATILLIITMGVF